MVNEVERSASATLAFSAMEAIAAGRFEDIFSVLGPHRAPGGQGLVLRAFLPWAGQVEVLERASGRLLGELVRVHESGLYELVLPQLQEAPAYQFRVNGESLLEDPYRFPSCLDSGDLYLFNEGTAEHVYRWLGAHQRTVEGVDGVLFSVWAPAARRVSVVGDFNGWDGRQHVLRKHPASGVWEIFLPGIPRFSNYKYEIVDAHGHPLPLKADPYARSMQHPPQTASRVLFDDGFDWSDGDWMASREGDSHLDKPVAIYEVHLGSWQRKPDEGNRYLSYRELADQLVPYVLDLGFTHVQLMPVSEFPFDGSWGYQPIGMYAPTIRYGTPDEFRYFVQTCHRHNIGVLVDWVPGHFPTDPHGLGRFDGTALYEHADTRQGYHPDWNTLVYNYGRSEVVSYLLSNANYWLDEFHVDGLRVDAVASMLYLDYSRDEGSWVPNRYGGRENLEAIDLLRAVNSRVYQNHPGIMMVAEESTAWPGVSRPVDSGGLGFGFKWNMGWMNDTLDYMVRDPIHRRYHHDEMTFSLVYAWDENFVLAVSHDEVVHGKRSLLDKMPGDEWQKFANLRAYLGYMWGHPGKKLLFMGCEFGQWREWDHDSSLDWHLLELASHRGVQSLVRDLNRLYRGLPALHSQDHSPAGFQWVQVDRREQSIFAWLRRGRDQGELVLVVSNMTPQTHYGYQVGVPLPGHYRESLNTDAREYGGSGQGNQGWVSTVDGDYDWQPCSLFITVPPLATVFFEYGGEEGVQTDAD